MFRDDLEFYKKGGKEDCWLLVVGCWLLAVGCWRLDAGCWCLCFRWRVTLCARFGSSTRSLSALIACAFLCHQYFYFFHQTFPSNNTSPVGHQFTNSPSLCIASFISVYIRVLNFTDSLLICLLLRDQLRFLKRESAITF